MICYQKLDGYRRMQTFIFMCPLLQFLVKAAHYDEEVNQETCNQYVIMKTIPKHIFGNFYVNCMTLTIF
jgi:hypothetical protein